VTLRRMRAPHRRVRAGAGRQQEAQKHRAGDERSATGTRTWATDPHALGRRVCPAFP
jgi:hypothetical protein